MIEMRLKLSFCGSAMLSTPVVPILSQAPIVRAGMAGVPMQPFPGMYCENSGAVIH